jgi:hypothetical protein
MTYEVGLFLPGRLGVQAELQSLCRKVRSQGRAAFEGAAECDQDHPQRALPPQGPGKVFRLTPVFVTPIGSKNMAGSSTQGGPDLIVYLRSPN